MPPVSLAPNEMVDFIPQGGNAGLHSCFLTLLTVAWQRIPVPDRQTILQFYRNRDHWYPRLILGPRTCHVSPVAMGGGRYDGFMAWFDSLAIPEILARPCGEDWAVAMIGEELAHALLLASGDLTHLSDPPNNDENSPDYQAWNNAREVAATAVLYGWGFDQQSHADFIAWLQTMA